MAKRYLPLSIGGRVCLSDRFYRRSFAVYHGVGSVSGPDVGECAGGVSAGPGGIWGAERDADGQRPAVRELARSHEVPTGNEAGPNPPHSEPAAPSDDAGEDRTVLEDDLGRVPGAGPVRHVRGGAGTDPVVGAVLQPSAAPPGDRGAVPGGSVLRDPAGDAGGDRTGDRAERERTGVARSGADAVLHGGSDGRTVGDDQIGKRSGQTGGGKSGRTG